MPSHATCPKGAGTVVRSGRFQTAISSRIRRAGSGGCEGNGECPPSTRRTPSACPAVERWKDRAGDLTTQIYASQTWESALLASWRALREGVNGLDIWSGHSGVISDLGPVPGVCGVFL